MSSAPEIKDEQFEPRIIVFLCNWCSYAGADKAGAAQIPYPPNVDVVRVMCSGRVDPQFVLQAFHNGADGVLILACHPGDCHYKEGNYRAAARHKLLLRLLRQFGIEDERCRFDYVSAGEGQKFVDVVTQMVTDVRKLGPLRGSHISRATCSDTLFPILEPRRDLGLSPPG
jgi:F420-non-reducing hydrogenase iron-sulfur subunit